MSGCQVKPQTIFLIDEDRKRRQPLWLRAEWLWAEWLRAEWLRAHKFHVSQVQSRGSQGKMTRKSFRVRKFHPFTRLPVSTGNDGR
jgi:hypothetical protein